MLNRAAPGLHVASFMTFAGDFTFDASARDVCVADDGSVIVGCANGNVYLFAQNAWNPFVKVDGEVTCIASLYGFVFISYIRLVNGIQVGSIRCLVPQAAAAAANPSFPFQVLDFDAHRAIIRKILSVNTNLVTCSDDGEAKVWAFDNTTWREIGSLKHNAQVMSAGYGNNVLFCGLASGSIHVYDSNFALIREMKQVHPTPIMGLQVIGTQLISAGQGGEVFIWSFADPSQPTHSFKTITKSKPGLIVTSDAVFQSSSGFVFSYSYSDGTIKFFTVVEPDFKFLGFANGHDRKTCINKIVEKAGNFYSIGDNGKISLFKVG